MNICFMQPLKLGCYVSMSFTVFRSAFCSAHCCPQKGQLWTILAVLASTLGPEDRHASKLSEYWELPYIRTDGDQDQVVFFFLFILKRYFQGCGSVMITFVSRIVYVYVLIYTIYIYII